MKSEFGKGLVTCLTKFHQHFSPEFFKEIAIYKGTFSSRYGEEKATSKGITLWANGASDHLYEIEAPKEEEWKEVRQKVKELQDLGLDMGHGMRFETIFTMKDVERLRELTTEILMVVNIKLNLNLQPKELLELDRRMSIKMDRKIGLKPDWGEW